MPGLHLQMFYESRQSVHVGNSDPCNNPNTELTSVPKSAEIKFGDSASHLIDAEQFEAPNGKGFETARFLISRAMLDPDATVIPA